MLDPMPEEAGGFARSIGRHIFQNMPDDPDRGATVEETIANVLDYAANRAVAAQDQANADFLRKVAAKWRKVISKPQAAVDPDAPLEPASETAGFDLSFVANAKENHPVLFYGSAALVGLLAVLYWPKS